MWLEQREQVEKARGQEAWQGEEEARMPGRRHEVPQSHMRPCRYREGTGFKNDGGATGCAAGLEEVGSEGRGEEGP